MARPPDIIWDALIFGSSTGWVIKNNDAPPITRPGIINITGTSCGGELVDPDVPPELYEWETVCGNGSISGRKYELTSSKSGDPGDPENYSTSTLSGTLEGPSQFTVYRFSDVAGDPFEGTPIGAPASISHVVQEGDTTWSGGTGGLTGRTFSNAVTYFLSGAKGVYTSAAEAASLEPFSTIDVSDPSYNFAPSRTVANDGFGNDAVMAGEYAIETKMVNLLDVKCRVTLASDGAVSNSNSDAIITDATEEVLIDLDAADTKVHKFTLGSTSAFLAQANYVSQLQTTITKYEVDENDDGNYVEKPIPPISELYAGMRQLWFQPNGYLNPPQGAPPLTIPTGTFQRYTNTYGDGSSLTVQRFDEFGNDASNDTYSPARDEANIYAQSAPSSINAPVPATEGSYIIRSQYAFGALFAGDDPLSTFGNPLT